MRSAGPIDEPSYRPDIDGLRAVAVVSVVGYHAGSVIVPGGFVGVDIFFVISGYLITGIILGQLDRGQFSTLDFYARRIRRIFPALIVVLSTVWVVGWLRLFPDQYRQLGEHMAGGAGFVSNFILRGEAGYFDNTAESKPLLHLWSLAIEEQFYLLWPVILAISFRRIASTWIIATIAIASFAFAFWSLRLDPFEAFYSPLGRFWELMIGGLLAQGLRVRPRLFERFREARAIVGLALIVYALATFQRGMPYPGWKALLPTVGAFLVISAGREAFANRLVLSNPIATWLGKISYPLYLWHWPLLSFLFIADGSRSSAATRAGLVAASVVLAWLTCRFVERPIRSRPDLRALPAGLLAAVVVVGVVGYGTYRADGFVDRFGDRGRFAAQFDDERPDMRYRARNDLFRGFREECNFYDFPAWRTGHSTNRPRAAIDPACTTRAAGTTHAVLIWGDSHAQHLNLGLREFLPRDVALLQVATSGCEAELVGTDIAGQSSCRDSNRFAMATAVREKPDVVVIAQRGGHSLRTLRAVAGALKRAGIRDVIVLGPIPQWEPDLNKIIASRYWPDTPVRLKDGLDAGTMATAQRLRDGLRPDEPFVFVDVAAALCDDTWCRTYVDDDRDDGLMTFDYGHMTPRASRFVARTIVGPPILHALQSAPTSEPASPKP